MPRERDASTFRPLEVIFTLDGAGLYYDSAEPPTLDGLLQAALIRHHVHGEPPARDEAPDDIPLPLARWHEGGTWGYHASALFPRGATAETLVYWRKRLRTGRIHLVAGSPNTQNGTWRDWNMPLPLLLAGEMVGWCVGDRRKVLTALRRSVRYLGKKRAHGHGRVTAIEVRDAPEDWSIARAGAPTRWMPAPDGPRLVRPRPPYWSSVGRVPCVEIDAAAIAAELG